MTAPFPKSQHALIYADPPWKYEMYSDKGKERSPDRHYDCMTQEEMLAMRDDVLFATAPDAVLVMWTTFAAGNIGGKVVDHLADALELIKAWGFQRVTGGPWIKRAATGNPAMGTGYTMRGSAELFLVATVGKPKVKHHSQRNLLLTGDWPADVADIESVIVDTMRREHSQKPDEMYDMLEALFPGPYLELFARTQRPGWTAWGNQTEKFTAEASCR